MPTPPTTASAWIQQWAHLVAEGGPILDVAAGNGRHARFFASRGHPVLALDRDDTVLGRMADMPGIAVRLADLENAPWPLAADEKFAAVVVTNYLHRPLFPVFFDALAPGGVLLYETFAKGNECVGAGKPSNPAFLLNPGELLDAVKGRLRVIAYQDGFTSAPRASCVQRICAVHEPGAAPDFARDHALNLTPAAGLTDRNNAPVVHRYVLPG
jgi:SAM-dependent methyltransferase